MRETEHVQWHFENLNTWVREVGIGGVGRQPVTSRSIVRSELAGALHVERFPVGKLKFSVGKMLLLISLVRAIKRNVDSIF